MEEKNPGSEKPVRKAAKAPRTGEKKSAARKTAPRRTKKQQGDIIFALDIGTRTVVGVLAEKTDEAYKIIDIETQAHVSRSMTDGQIEDIDAVAAVVKSVKTALERRQSVKLQRVCIAAAGRALSTLRHSSEYDVSGRSSIRWSQRSSRLSCPHMLSKACAPQSTPPGWRPPDLPSSLSRR